MAQQTSRTLSSYLATSEAKTASDIVKAKAGARQSTVGPQHSPLGQLYVRANPPHPPRWASFFERYISPTELGQISTTGAVLIMQAAGRLFAISFGQGYHLLRTELLEERFGLLVALNSIGENSLRSIDKRTFEAIAKHSKEQTSVEASADAFGLDVERDLVRAVTGTPTDKSLGNRMAGMDALSIHTEVTIDGMEGLLSLLYERFADTHYRTAFPWVDHLKEVRNPGSTAELNDRLEGRLQRKESERIWMAVPEVLDWARVDGFRYSQSTASFLYEDVRLSDFRSSVAPKPVTIELLKKRHVYVYDADGTSWKDWRAYDCLYAELDIDSKSYLLSNGKWFAVSPDFVSEVNASYRSLPRYSCQFPEFDDIDEATYNKRLAATMGDIVLMDQRFISYGGGRNKVELCDLYTIQKDMIHVKRYGNSSVLSHLFQQAMVSAELFRVDPQFRTLVNQMLPARFGLADPAMPPQVDEYGVVYAVISHAPGDLVIPFFSRVSLKHAARRLQAFGYKLSICRIAEARARTVRKRKDLPRRKAMALG